MSGQVATSTVIIKGIGDFSDVVSNVGSVQKALTKLKLPDKLGDNLNKNIGAFYKEYEKYQKKITEGIKTQGDYNQVEKSLNNMRSLYQAIGKDIEKVTKLDMGDMLDLDSGEFKALSKELTDIMKQIGSTKIDTTPFTQAFKDIRGITKSSKVTGDNGILSQMIGYINTGQIVEAKKQLQELQAYANKVAPRTTADNKQAPGTLSAEKYAQLTNAINIMSAAFSQADDAVAPLIQKQNELQNELDETKQKASRGLADEFSGYNQASKEVDSVTESLKKMHQEEFSFNREAQNIDRQIQSYFGLSQMIRKVGDIAKDAFATVKELDKAMTETAVVTNFDVGDMWEMLPTYTAQANQLGSTIKDVYEAATLYYQQGLNTNQAMSLANETLKMARIAGLDAADATNMMTAALRGFNMEINQMSAQRVNDVYSELAAITASDTREIGSAMERTASIANSANMEFETTSAFLAQMIETTREAPENLGTAMKTIVARFQEMKKDPTKLIDSEGIAMDANKVDTALKSIGVNLTNTKGEFRDLDDVFLDISAKWDSLTQGQQRYIATIAAGSRQQSRFIAMMSDHERTMELVDAANNSAGASQRQFEKTLESMEAKLNKLKNAWDQFTMGLMNNQILKFGVDALTKGFTIVNKFIDLLSKIPSKPFEGITKSALTLITTLGMLNFGKKATRGLVMGGAGWFKGETSLADGFKQGWTSTGQTGFFKNKKNTTEAEQQGDIDGQAYGCGWAKAVQAIQTKQQTGRGLFGQTIDQIKKNQVSMGSNADTLKALYPHSELSAEAQEIANDFLNMLRTELSKGTISTNQLPDLFDSKFSLTQGLSENFDADNIKQAVEAFEGKKLESIGTGFDGMTSHINSAGVALSNFGMILQGTPLEPFGTILTTVGGALISLSTVLATTKAAFLEQWAAATLAAAGEETEAVAALTAAAANGTLTVSAITAAGGMATLATAIGLVLLPLLAIAAAIGVAVLAYKGLDAAIETNAEKLEAAQDAAAAASEAYDSAKQETSELADAISKIEESEAAFDGLVAGTAEFNDQLVTANEQIMALIDKYPMLMDASKNYVTTDENGLMHISKAGLDAVKEYQKQIQAQASAINLIQTAELNALENQQKANDLRNKVTLQKNGEVPKGKQDEYEKNQREADLLEQRADAEVKLARENAIRTALNGKELSDINALTAVYSGLYEQKRKSAEVEVEGLGKHDVRQKYADYHGYSYDKSTKKIKDVEGNEVDYDDKVIKDEVIEQTVLLDFEANAQTLEVVLNDIDQRFSESLGGTFENSSHFISDVLSSNIETNEDILEKVLSENSFQDIANSLTEKEMAAILGISAESIDSTNENQYINQIADILSDKAQNIAETQSKSYEELGIMLAKSSGASLEQLSSKQQQQELSKQIKDLTSEQAHTMSKIGAELQQGAGVDSMSTYINTIKDLYKTNEKSAEEIQDVFSEADLTTASGRLEAYTKLVQSSTEETRNLGEALLNSSDSANLLGDTFTEFMDEWEGDLAENADNFKNAMGEIDAAGIMEASKESHTLNTLLESGQVSASGMAMALQGVEEGKYAVADVDSAVLQLLSSMNRLADAALEAHNIIENFDAGIDTGEGEDFVKENAEKAKEYWDNGEVGNQQLQNYIKLAAGTERWNKALENSNGNIYEAEKSLMKYVTTFENGFEAAWDQMASGQGINGKDLSKNIANSVNKKEISAELGEKFKKVETSWDSEGFLNVDFGELTTSELETYFEKAYGVSQEYAKLLVQDLANYDAEVSSQLSKNDLQAAVQTGELQNRQVGDNLVLTDAELKVFKEAGGSMKELEQAAAAAGQTISEFKVLDENGERREDYTGLLQDYAKTFQMGTEGNIKGLFEEQKLQDKNGILDLSKLIADTQSKGFDQQQAMQAAWQTYKEAQRNNEEVSYEGVKLEEGIDTYEKFTASFESALESSKWESIGEAIAQGIINYINKDTPSEKPEQANTQEKERGAAEQSRQTQQDLANKQAEAIKGALGKLKLTEEEKSAARNQKMTGGNEVQPQATEKVDTTQSDQSTLSLQTAAAQMTTTATTLNTAGTNLSQSSTSLSTAATNLNSAASTLKTSNTLTVKNTPAAQSAPKGGGTTVQKVSVQPQAQNVKVPPQTMKVSADTSSALARIRQLISLFNKTYTLKYKASGPTSIKVPISANFTGPWEKSVKITKTGAKGINNHVSFRPSISLGSLAKGSRYGTVGPKDRGGLTLTGEEGFEIAWLPSENRSMILGLGGPQMIDLPNDAVVYTHEQSEEILKREAVDAGSQANTRRRKGGGSGGSKKSKKKKSKKSKKKSKKKNKNKNKNKNKETINNFSMEEVVRFNIDQSLTRLTDQIADRTKEIENVLTKIGSTYNDIVDSTQAQVGALQQVKTKNQELLASYQRQLAEYHSRQAIVSYTDSKGNSKDKKISIETYLNPDGSANEDAIRAAGGREVQEAIYKEISSAKSIVDGINNANKAIKDADQQIADLGKKISEAFYQWENELTEVYDLTQRINNEVSFTDRFTSQIELELSKLKAGFGDTAESIENVRDVLNRNNKTIREQIANQQQMIAARQRELEAALSYQDEIDKRKKFEDKTDWGSTAEKDATIAWAREQETGAMLGNKYVKNLFKDIDGSIQYEIDWERFNADNEINPYSKTTYEAIKKYLDELNDTATEFNNAIKDQTDFIKDLYDKLSEYQDFIADMEDTLIKGVEELIEETKDNAKDLSDAITDALEDLLDEVKRKLDERRRQEDNAKTERDISQKQQRLAMLRADTSGGNQVEIAQLEKEIAEAQQDYQRTLEDQLLDRLQEQADEAAKQRERQIELLETIAGTSGTDNRVEVETWLKNPAAYKKQIRDAWLEAQGYDEKGWVGKYVLEQQFESEFTELVTAVEETNLKNNFEALDSDANTIIGVLEDLTNGNLGREDKLAHGVNSLLDVTDRNTTSILTEIQKGNLADLRKQGVDAATLKSMKYDASTLMDIGGYTPEELQKAGFTAKEVFDAGITDIKSLKDAGYKASDIKKATNGSASDFKEAEFTLEDLKDIFDIKELLDANFSLKDFHDVGISASALKENGLDIQQLKNAGYSLPELKGAFSAEEFKAGNISYADAKAAEYTMWDLNGIYDEAATEIANYNAAVVKQQKIDAYKNKVARAASNKKMGADEFKSVIAYANAAGISMSQMGKDLADTKGLTWEQVVKAAKKAGYGKSTVKSWWYGYGGYAKKAIDKWSKFKTGGLANYTGPAWLDGTPSKPELVLNATDTKNFIALKDVLSRAMSSTSDLNSGYGDVNYEININVEKLTSDYDVDKVADRVKKIIVKDSSYRNVTQVRKFR